MLDLRHDVDAFLAAEKSLPRAGVWAQVNRADELRMRLPVEIDGEVSQSFVVEMIVAPNAIQPSLRIVILYGPCIFRLEMTSAGHQNSFNRPADLPSFVEGPHYHGWTDNRRFARANRLPKDLDNARILPNSVVSFDDAFRWFIEETGFDFPSWGPPEWPQRTGLI